MVAFVASIGTAFTGYLSQSNFDSQWIGAAGARTASTPSASAPGSTCSTPGQMLLWHVVLLPLVVGVITVLHVVLVRRHGVVPPIDARRGGLRWPPTMPTRSARRRTAPDSHDVPTRPYDLVKEFVIALVVVTPADRGPGRGLLLPRREGRSPWRRWAKAAPGRRRRDRRRRAGRHHHERDATARRTTTAPPGRRCSGIPLQKWGGVRIPVDSARTWSCSRWRDQAGPQPAADGGPRGLARRLRRPSRPRWATGYADALAKAPDGDPAKVAAGRLRPGPGDRRRLPRPGRAPAASRGR